MNVRNNYDLTLGLLTVTG